jgi:RNA-splicing ligase RtcB
MTTHKMIVTGRTAAAGTDTKATTMIASANERDVTATETENTMTVTETANTAAGAGMTRSRKSAKRGVASARNVSVNASETTIITIAGLLDTSLKPVPTL